MDRYMDFEIYGRILGTSANSEGEAMIANRRLKAMTKNLEEGSKVHISFMRNTRVSRTWLSWAFDGVDSLKIDWGAVEFMGSTPIQVIQTVMDYAKTLDVVIGVIIHSPNREVTEDKGNNPPMTAKQAIDDLFG